MESMQLRPQSKHLTLDTIPKGNPIHSKTKQKKEARPKTWLMKKQWWWQTKSKWSQQPRVVEGSIVDGEEEIREEEGKCTIKVEKWKGKKQVVNTTHYIYYNYLIDLMA